MQYNISFDIAAVILNVGLLTYFIAKRSVATRERNIFGYMLWVSLASNILDIITAQLSGVGHNIVLINVLNILYLWVFNTLPLLYYMYFMLTIKHSYKHWRAFEKAAIGIPYIPTMLLLFTTPAHKLIFFYNNETGYTHGKLFMLLSVCAFLYMLYALIASLAYRKRFSVSQKAALYFYGFGTLIGIVVQLILPTQLVMHFGSSLALLLAYLSTSNFADDEDVRYGVYNKLAFIKKIGTCIDSKERVTVIGINVKGHEGIREVLGIGNERIFYKKVIDTIKKTAQTNDFFLVTDDQYVLVIQDDENIKEIGIKLTNKFKEPVPFEGNNLIFDMSMFKIEFPIDAKNIEEVLDILEIAARRDFSNKDGEIEKAGSEMLEQKKRENLIVQIMQKAIHDKSFQVYYQPIYNVKKKYYHSAEALIRLIDKELGFISPEEFIPLAEKKGLILDIGDFVFEQVCKDMSSHKFAEHGISYIEVNLSVVQCMQNNLTKRLTSVMEKYGIKPEQIDLEITETSMVVSGDTLKENMRKLNNYGCTFAMDDFGTGFSNLSAMIRYPFNIVKLDKSMVWSAMEDIRAMGILKHSIEMLKDLEINIVAEGVETQSQANVLEVLGCDYFQGYFYSKPVPVNQFLSVIDRVNLVVK